MASFWLGLSVGVLHWWLFLVAVRRLCGSSDDGKSPLWRASISLSWLRLALTGLMLYVLLHCGVTPGPMLGGLLVSGLVFRVLAHRRASRL